MLVHAQLKEKVSSYNEVKLAIDRQEWRRLHRHEHGFKKEKEDKII